MIDLKGPIPKDFSFFHPVSPELKKHRGRTSLIDIAFSAGIIQRCFVVVVVVVVFCELILNLFV